MMVRLLLASVLVVTAAFAHVIASVAQDDTCLDFVAYVEAVDAAMAEALLEVMEDEQWQEDMALAAAKASRSDLSILVLSVEEAEPFIEFITVPGDVLLMFEEDRIPAIAMDLHESALQGWLLIPSLTRAVLSSGLIGALPFAEEIEEIDAANLASQTQIETTCPSELDELKARAERSVDVFADDNETALTDLIGLTQEDVQGIAIDVLLYFASDANPVTEPTGNDADQINNITIAQTEVAQARATVSVQETTVAQAALATETPVATRNSGTVGVFSVNGSPSAVELFALLPDAAVVPEGLDTVEDTSRAQQDVAAALGGSRDAETNLETWGWSANVERAFIASDPSALAPDAVSSIVVSAHGFADEGAATEALTFFSDIVVANGYQETEADIVGSTSRLLALQDESGGTTVALYMQEGPVLYRIGGFSLGGDPSQAVIDLAKTMLAQ